MSYKLEGFTLGRRAADAVDGISDPGGRHSHSA